MNDLARQFESMTSSKSIGACPAELNCTIRAGAEARRVGHSPRGITAYQLAARYPELVRALVIEDVGAVMRKPEVEHPILDVRGWPTRAPSLAALGQVIEARGVPDASYFLQSAVPHGDGWRLLFDPDEMMDVQRHGLGDWWPDWLGSSCPALLLRGGRSMLLPSGLSADMAHRRPCTTLVELPAAGHWIHDDDPDAARTPSSTSWLTSRTSVSTHR